MVLTHRFPRAHARSEEVRASAPRGPGAAVRRSGRTALRRTLGLAMTLLLAAGLGGCSSTVVRDHYVATPPTSPGGSPGMTRVRMATQGPDWSLGCMTQCGQMQTTLCSLAGQQAVQALQAREAGAQDQTLRAQCVSRELDALLLDPAARRGASEEALRLEAVNAICLGLGAPGPFATLAEARAFLDRAAARERAQP